MTDETDWVRVPRKALQFILEQGCFQDEGPFPDGWCSEEMREAIAALEKALAQ